MSLRSPGQALSFPLPSTPPCWECETTHRPRTLYQFVRESDPPGTLRIRIYLCRECKDGIAAEVFGDGELVPVFPGKEVKHA